LDPIRIDGYSRHSPTSIEFLTENEIELTEERLNELIVDLAPNTQFQKFSDEDQWSARAEKFIIAIKRNRNQKGIWDCEKQHPEMRERFPKAEDHVLVSVQWFGIEQDDPSYRIANELVRKLAGPSCLAVNDTTWMTWEAFSDWSVSCEEKSKFVPPPVTEYVWGFTKEEPEKRNREFEAQLNKAFEKFTSTSNSNQKLSVDLAVQFGEVTEMVPVSIETAELETNFIASFTGKVTKDSKLLPFLLEGRKVEFNYLQVHGFEFDDGNSVHKATRMSR
jgi:hypothetical protein